jgi:hypothetical protein
MRKPEKYLSKILVIGKSDTAALYYLFHPEIKFMVIYRGPGV